MGAAVTRVYLADTRQTRRYSSPLAKYSLLHARALHTKRPLAATNPNSQSDDYFSRGCNDTGPHCPRVQTAVRPVITLDKVTEDFVLLQTPEFSSCVFLSLSLFVYFCFKLSEFGLGCRSAGTCFSSLNVFYPTTWSPAVWMISHCGGRNPLM